jgi:hypothetical protein
VESLHGADAHVFIAPRRRATQLAQQQTAPRTAAVTMLASASKPRLAGLLLAALLALARGAAASSGIVDGECDTSTTTSCAVLWRNTGPHVPTSVLAGNNGFVYVMGALEMMRCSQEVPNSCSTFNTIKGAGRGGFGPMAFLPSGDQIVVGAANEMARRAGVWPAAVHASCATLSAHCPPHAVAL